jgi:predicted amino acid dehydrogenase
MDSAARAMQKLAQCWQGKGRAMAERRIACLSLLPSPGSAQGCVDLAGRQVRWTVFPVKPDLDALREQIGKLLGEYDAVCIDGVASTFRIGPQTIRYEYLWRALELERWGARVSDGSGVQAIVERHLVRQAAEELKTELMGARILFCCGLIRYGSAEVLSGYSQRLVFGDFLYGFRLGLPVVGFRNFVRQAPQLAQVVSRAPLHWFWPATRVQQRVLPRFSLYMQQADVIVGGISYFQRFAPASLAGKTIFTNIYRDEDLEHFAQRKARRVVSLTPFVQGQYLPLPVLGALLKLEAFERLLDDPENYYLEQIHALELRPQIIELTASVAEPVPCEEAVLPDEAVHALASLPPERRPFVPHRKPSVLSDDEDVARFCFVVHPLTMRDMERLPMVRALKRLVPPRVIEDAAAQAAPILLGALRNVVSATGARAEGLIYAIPMTSKAIMRFPPEFMYKRLLQVAQQGHERGCRLLGLGAYTSVAGDAGLTVSQRAPLGVTSGNSYTVAATLLTLTETAEKCGIKVSEACAMVIGATGSIGSVCARLLAPQVSELFLVSPRPERLLALARQIEEETPRLAGRVHLARKPEAFLPLASLVVTTTSAVEPVIDVTCLRPGAVVCDVARPPDIKEAAARKRRDVLVVESGEILLPEGAELTTDIGLPRGVIYACLAETLLLALERKFEHYTLGRAIDPAKVREMAQIGEKHGFKLAPIRSFGRPVTSSHLERLRRINAR